jgi:phosphocarrier protein
VGSNKSEAGKSEAGESEAGKFVGQARIVNVRGLHARAAATFVKLAETFKAQIVVTADGTDVPGRSIMGLLLLAAGPGTDVMIAATGADAERAVLALLALIEAGFHEDLGEV